RSFGASGGVVVESLALPGGVRRKRRQKLGLVIGEVQIHSQIRCQRDQGNQICRLHLGGDKTLRGIHRAVDLLRTHGRKIEKEEHQPPVTRIQRGAAFFPARRTAPATAVPETVASAAAAVKG